MNPTTLKLTEELAADIRARVKALDFGAVEKIARAKEQNGTFDVIISTEIVDRAGEMVRQDGWDLTNYKNNPIVLWGHDYYSMPIGACTETYLTEKDGVPALGARGVFLPAEINPFAQQVRKLYEFGLKQGQGVGCTTSVGFIPRDFDDNNRTIITRAELLEFSFVPIPANQGVGPAQGRALTFDEAKELDLDVASLRVKGLEFTEKTACKGAGVCEDGECDHNVDQKDAKPGDDCSMADGTAGELATDPKDPDGALVCIPKQDDKAKSTERKPEKELIKSLQDEHGRHTGEVEKALDDFRDKSEGLDKEAIQEGLKDFRSVLEDEHTNHRAKSIACLRAFEPESKSFDRKAHLKTLREADDAYTAECKKTFDQFEERCAKGTPEETDGHIDWLAGELEKAQRTNKKGLIKIAKALCRDAFGEEETADEQTVAILREFLTPHIDPLILNSVISKVGARISTATREKLREAHEHLKSATAIVEALHGALGDSDGEEGRSDGDGKTLPAKAPEKQRSRPAGDATGKTELDAHLLARDVLRGVTTAASAALERINAEARIRNNGRGTK